MWAEAAEVTPPNPDVSLNLVTPQVVIGLDVLAPDGPPGSVSTVSRSIQSQVHGAGSGREREDHGHIPIRAALCLVRHRVV